MLKKGLRIGAIALVGVLVIGAVVMLVLPERAEAAYGRGQGAGRGPAVADPVRAAPIVAESATDDLGESEVEAWRWPWTTNTKHGRSMTRSLPT